MSDSATPWTVAYQAPPSMGSSRQEYWSGLPFPSPGDLPDPGVEPGSPALQADTLLSEPPGKAVFSENTPFKRWIWSELQMTGNSRANIWGPRGALEAGAASADAAWWAFEKPQSDYCGWWAWGRAEWEEMRLERLGQVRHGEEGDFILSAVGNLWKI